MAVDHRGGKEKEKKKRERGLESSVWITGLGARRKRSHSGLVTHCVSSDSSRFLRPQFSHLQTKDQTEVLDRPFPRIPLLYPQGQGLPVLTREKPAWLRCGQQGSAA